VFLKYDGILLFTRANLTATAVGQRGNRRGMAEIAVGDHRQSILTSKRGHPLRRVSTAKTICAEITAAVMPSCARPFQKLCCKAEIKFFMSLSVISSGTFFRQGMGNQKQKTAKLSGQQFVRHRAQDRAQR
jgi:hypothetical protein